MPIEKGLDVHNDLLAHVDAAFHSGRAHVRQQHDLARARQFDELGVDGGLMLEHVQTGTGDLARRDQPHQGIFVDDFAARSVDDIGLRTDELEPPGRKQVISCRGMGAIDGDDVHSASIWSRLSQ